MKKSLLLKFLTVIITVCSILCFCTACINCGGGEEFTNSENVSVSTENSSIIEEHDHDWMDATCTAPKTCSICGETNGETLKHNFVNGSCEVCGKSIDDYLEYTLLKDGTYSIKAKETVGFPDELVIPDTYEGKPITVIPENAFANCTTITNVIIGNNVTVIGSYAFYLCINITEINITNNITIIGDNAFNGCVGLITVVIGDSVTKIGDYAFANCTNIVNLVIGNNVTVIGSYAFYLCINITEINITNNVTIIGDNAFNGCEKLIINCEQESKPSGWEEDWNSSNNEVNWGTRGETSNEYFTFTLLSDDTYSIEAKSVNNMPERVIIPSSYNGKAVTFIDDYAFYDCDSLTSIVIPDSVTSIDDCAFRGCSSLTSVVIGDSVTSIGDSAFAYCSSLTSIEIPDSVTSIGEKAFLYCGSLTSVVIGDSVTSIGSNAFQYCIGLTSVVIGDSVTSIGYGAFASCSSLKEVYYNGTADGWKNITIYSSNYNLENATRYYYSESQPTEEGNFWHYDENGEIVEW